MLNVTGAGSVLNEILEKLQFSPEKKWAPSNASRMRLIPGFRAVFARETAFRAQEKRALNPSPNAGGRKKGAKCVLQTGISELTAYRDTCVY